MSTLLRTLTTHEPLPDAHAKALEHYAVQAALLAAGSRRANRILLDAEQMRMSANGGGSYAYMVGVLTSEIRKLCEELAAFTGDGHKAAPKYDILELSLDDATVQVEFQYRAGSPGRTDGPPENCYESEPAEVDICQALINGVWINPCDVLSQDVLDRWAEKIEEAAVDNAEAAKDDAAEAAHAARMERDYE
jgi:hypothetical protein